MADALGAFYKMSLVRVTLSLATLLHFFFFDTYVFAAPRGTRGTRAPRATRPPRVPKRPPAEIKEQLIKYNVIPDIIPVAGCPRQEIQVVWPMARAKLGNAIPSQYTKQEPNVTWPISRGQIYTLLMVDPDRDKLTEFEDHEYMCWLVGNIPGTNMSAGQKITDYIPPIKPRALDFHRFIFLIFKHANKTVIKFDEPRLISDSDAFRAHFRTLKFMQKYGFKNAYAVNFFHGEWEAWAPPDDESDIYETEEYEYSKTTPHPEKGGTKKVATTELIPQASS